MYLYKGKSNHAADSALNAVHFPTQPQVVHLGFDALSAKGVTSLAQ
jgi:hypothetical protein